MVPLNDNNWDKILFIILGSIIATVVGIIGEKVKNTGKLYFFVKYFSVDTVYILKDDSIGGRMKTEDIDFYRINIDFDITNSSMYFQIMREMKFLLKINRKSQTPIEIWDNSHSIGNGSIIEYLKISPRDLSSNQFCLLLNQKQYESNDKVLFIQYCNHKGKLKTKKLGIIPKIISSGK